jgi:hypothetical protein
MNDELVYYVYYICPFSMPLSAAVPSQSKKSGGKKALEGASKKKKKRGGPDAIAVPPGKKIERKSEKGSRKVSSSAVSGKVAEIINPLVLFYWNGRGLMEAPRMMLGWWHKPNIQARHFACLILIISQPCRANFPAMVSSTTVSPVLLPATSSMPILAGFL